MTEAVSESSPRALPSADLLAIGACSLIWGTTWYAITRQFGVVPAVISVAYRFAIAAALIFAWRLINRRSVKLTPAQHLAALGQGVFTFAANYPFVYMAEERIASGVVAVTFAGLAFVNLVVFRLVHKTRAAWSAWAGATLGVAGVAMLSLSELLGAHMDNRAVAGLGFAFVAVAAAAIGNLFAHRSQATGAEIAPSTGWAMAYGSGLLAVYALVAGVPFRFDMRPAYVLSLIYLAALGSVAAFLIYFGLARRRGFTLASYVSALTPPLALAMSALFEHARIGIGAVAGVVLVLAGQVLLIRAPKS